jgi:hypothetical protein
LPRFKLVSLRETQALSTFVCQHLTPQLVRRPAWLAHANGVIGIAGVTVIVEATAPLAAAYEKVFGARVVRTDAVLTVHADAHRIVFAEPDDFTALYPEAELDLARPLPAMADLTLKTRDPAVPSII